MSTFKLCACVCVHDDIAFLAAALKSLPGVSILAAISKVDWNGQAGNWKDAQKVAKEAGATVHLGEWTSEEKHREAAYAEAQRLGFTHAIIADSDEVIEPRLLEHLVQISSNDLADRVYVEWDTYWHDTAHVIRPRERFTPCILINLTVAKNIRLREFEGGRALFLNESYGIIHHLSYVGDDERIAKKIRTWGHKNEVIPQWFQRSWLGWQVDPLLTNLHPTHPDAYLFAEHIEPPAILRDLGLCPAGNELQVGYPSGLEPQFSVCMPLYGGESFVRQTLDALERCRDLLHEVIVVDNASPDGAMALVAEHGWITVIKNENNRGFAAASNQAYEASTGRTVLFLNSDALVTRSGLVQLAESLYESGSIGAAAPLTNFACTEQAIQPCVTSLDNLERFATDVAHREVEDTDSDFLIGFCLAVKRPILEELGPFDERFVMGGAEDTELCYRLRRSGYRIVVSQRSYIHHIGSQTFSSMQGEINLRSLFDANDNRFHRKWAHDVESGFASHLSGQSRERIRFDESKRPKPRRLESLAKKADISLCMIVRDEERVLGECLASARPFFREILVMDTGSKDRTVEIAQQAGAQVRSMTWPDSFARARTASMEGAKGKWVMWLDADDTLPEHCGELILEAVLNAPDDIVAFVVPVRFVEEQGFGTAVDHVKVFRNFPGLEWEGRIHEQILASLRAQATKSGFEDGGKIARLAAYVLHSGYDNSPEGQSKKRLRDHKLLKLDLKDRPNHPFVLFNLGMTDHYSGEHAGAVKWLRKSIAHSGPGDSQLRKAYALLGASLRALGKQDEARVVLERGLAAVPGDPEIQFYLAQIAAEAGDHDKAIELYQAVLCADISAVFSSIDPGILGYKTRHNLAMAYLAGDQYSSAREQWQLSLQNEPRIDTAATLFEAAAEREDMPTCRQALSWVRSNIGYVGPWASMVLKLSELTALDPIVHFDAVLKMDPENIDVRKAMGLHLLNSGQPEAAIGQFEILQSRKVPEGAYFLGVIAEQVGDLTRALGWFEYAHTLNPAHVETILRINALKGQIGENK